MSLALGALGALPVLSDDDRVPRSCRLGLTLWLGPSLCFAVVVTARGHVARA